MRGSTHLAGGLLAGVLVHQIVGAPSEPEAWVIGLAAAGVGSLAPDWFQVSVPGVNGLRGATGHRGFSHWLLTAGLVFFALRGISPVLAPLAPFALAGWLSHILLDMFADGVPAFWPVAKRVTLAHVPTGGAMDSWVGAALLVLAGVLGIATVML